MLTTCQFNNSIRANNNIKTNYDYKQYLIKNGLNIMEKILILQINATKSCPNPSTYYNNKYIYKNCSDQTQPYGYETSDLKKMYLSRNDLQIN